MPNERASFKTGRMLLYAAAFCPFFIGSGVGSGMEIEQFFAAWGRGMYLAAGVAFVLLLFTVSSYARAGAEGSLKEGESVCSYYCGKALGRFFNVFSAVFSYAGYIYMTAGAGTVLEEHFGVPLGIGTLALSAVILAVVLLGLKRIVEILGRTEWLMILGVLLVCGAALAESLPVLKANMARMTADYTVTGFTRCTSPTAFISGAAEPGGCILWSAAFVERICRETEYKREARRGMALGCFLVMLCVFVMSLSFIGCQDIIGSAAVPMVTLAGALAPWAGTAYAVILVLGICSSAIPLLWSTASLLAPEEKSRRFRLWVLLLGVPGVVLPLLIPYKTLVNYIILIGGYVVYILIGAVAVKEAKRLLKKKTAA